MVLICTKKLGSGVDLYTVVILRWKSASQSGSPENLFLNFQEASTRERWEWGVAFSSWVVYDA